MEVTSEMMEEAAWLVIMQKRWVATPQLLFAIKDVIRERILPSEQAKSLIKEVMDLDARKALTHETISGLYKRIGNEQS